MFDRFHGMFRFLINGFGGREENKKDGVSMIFSHESDNKTGFTSGW